MLLIKIVMILLKVSYLLKEKIIIGPVK